MGIFIAVPVDWTPTQAEDFQRLHNADGILLGPPAFAPNSPLPLVWTEESVLGEEPVLLEDP